MSSGRFEDGPFGNASLVDIVALMTKPLAIERPKERIYLKITSEIPIASREEVEQFQKDAKRVVIVSHIEGTPVSEMVWMCCNKRNVETELSARVRCHFTTNQLNTWFSNTDKLCSHIANTSKFVQYRIKPVGQKTRCRPIPHSVLNHYRLIQAIYKPLKAFPEDFPFDDPSVCQAIEHLRRADPWQLNPFGDRMNNLIKSSKLVCAAIDAHVHTKYQKEALKHFNALKCENKAQESKD